MSSQLIEVICEKCGKTYMAEVDTKTGEYYGGCPHCKEIKDDSKS